MNDPSGANQKLLEENAALKRKIKELEHAEARCTRMEQEAIRKDGTESLSVERIKDGWHAVGIVRDMSGHQQAEEERKRLFSELQESIAKVKTLSGMLPTCSSCKKIRDDRGHWEEMEVYISEHSEANFSHGICPACVEKFYPQYRKKEVRRVEEEKRRFPRKSVSTPALLTFKNETFAGVVLNVSLGGLLISIPGDAQLEIEEETSVVSIVFTLPEIKNALSARCIPRHIVHTDAYTKIGVSFANTDFANYQALRDYLIY